MLPPEHTFPRLQSLGDLAMHSNHSYIYWLISIQYDIQRPGLCFVVLQWPRCLLSEWMCVFLTGSRDATGLMWGICEGLRDTVGPDVCCWGIRFMGVDPHLFQSSGTGTSSGSACSSGFLVITFAGLLFIFSP